MVGMKLNDLADVTEGSCTITIPIVPHFLDLSITGTVSAADPANRKVFIQFGVGKLGISTNIGPPVPIAF